MLAPSRAELRTFKLAGRDTEGAVKGTTVDEGPDAGEAAGGSATACCLDHISLCLPNQKRTDEAPGGREQRVCTLDLGRESKQNIVVPPCALKNLTAGT